MNKLKYLILLLAFAALLILAIVGYEWFSENYVSDNIFSESENRGESEDTLINETKSPETMERTGDEMPDFTVYDMDGNTVSLSEFVGKPVVLNFWATWCTPCKMEMPAFDRAASEYGEDIHFLMVNMTDGFRDTESSVAAFMEDSGYSFSVYLDKDGNASSALGVFSIPQTYFIWEDGTLMDTYMGTMSETKLYSYLDVLKGIE